MRSVLFLVVTALVLVAPVVVLAQETDAAVCPPTTPAAEVSNIERGFPTQVIDVVPVAPGRIEAGLAGGYVTNGNTFETGLMRVNYGVIDDVQASIYWPLILGEGRVEGNGDTNLAVLWRAVMEDDMMPALGVELSGRTPTGLGFTGYDGTITGIASKMVGEARVNVNAAYTTIGNNRTASRNDADFFGAGVDFPVMDNAVAILDVYSQESQVIGNDRVNVVELGGRMAISDTDTVSAGVGAGIGNGNATPDFLATLGYQRVF